jgi:hypothetical protein|tara:strand:- start:36 stop:167 length:132 start_codon:yes stop_codon:yes gene_type:complete
MKYNIKQLIREISGELIAAGLLLTIYAALVFWVLVFRVTESTL